MQKGGRTCHVFILAGYSLRAVPSIQQLAAGNVASYSVKIATLLPLGYTVAIVTVEEFRFPITNCILVTRMSKPYGQLLQCV
jgi:hypothetical protein